MTSAAQRLHAILGSLSTTEKTELSQANTRVLVALGFTLFCLAWEPTMPHIAGPGIPIGLLYMAMAVIYRLAVRTDPARRRWRIVLGIVIDQTTISLYTFLVGVSSSMVYPLYLWVVIGNGYRFGMQYLYLAMAYGTLTLAGAVYLSPAWSDFEIVAIGELFGLLAIGIFSGRLIQRLEQARAQLESRALDAEHRATHDDLTGLANRALLDAFLSNQLARMERYPSGHLLGLLYIDLDLFKDVNDAYGHDAGDQLLIQAANRLESCVREVDLVVRLGGDEFILVTPEIEGPQSLEMLAERVLKELSRPFHLNSVGQTATISASIGMVISPHHGQDRESLLNKADEAMYQAKRMGRHRYTWAPTNSPDQEETFATD
jgi:diguanylate cyclase (GGDEF)-like protein